MVIIFNEYLFSWPFIIRLPAYLGYIYIYIYIQKILPSSYWISNSLKRFTETKYPFVLSRRSPILIFVTASNLPPFKLFLNVIPRSLVGNDRCYGGWRMRCSNLLNATCWGLLPKPVFLSLFTITFPFLSFILFINFLNFFSSGTG